MLRVEKDVAFAGGKRVGRSRGFSQPDRQQTPVEGIGSRLGSSASFGLPTT